MEAALLPDFVMPASLGDKCAASTLHARPEESEMCGFVPPLGLLRTLFEHHASFILMMSLLPFTLVPVML